MTELAHIHGMPIFRAPKGFHDHLPDFTVRLVMNTLTVTEDMRSRGMLARIKHRMEMIGQRRSALGAAKQHDAQFEWLAENVKEGATIFWQDVSMGEHAYPMYIVFQRQKDAAAFMLVH